LEALADASLVREDPDTGRWRMHDLVRAYATEQAQRHPHSTTALTRLHHHYTRTTRAAHTHLDPTGGVDREHFPNRGAALAWLDAERANLLATVHQAHTLGHRETTMELAALLGTYLHSRRYLQDALDTATLAHDAAMSFGSRRHEGVAWNNLGNALQELRRFDQALDAHQHALDIHHELGNRHSEGIAWNNLATALQELRRFDQALDAYQHALDIHHELGNRHSEGIAWNNLGLTFRELRRLDEAFN
ncbi:tetratricopeptide repeat protein, partial [Kitasatospora sp. NPDC088134]|uniref:tetratricopeptide repeat protein n=1 Tax=Kitasatospora sp. NPDC088134 TaxID=3364071 RepID=UPI0037FEC42D